MIRRPPHIVVTTPESLYLLLTSEGGRGMLRTTSTLIIDEIHALVRDKRGSHLALSVERLEALAGRRLVRIGLSATQKPIEEVARFLVGAAQIGADGVPNCNIVDAGHSRKLDLAIEMPKSPLEAVMSGEVWEEIYDRLATLILEHRTTLVFVNTRRMAERVCRHLGERIGDEFITSHHGSLSRERRLDAEQRLKSGDLRALVATASLELGIDIGAVDLVCQLGTTRSIAALMQRVGRSGHTVGGSPKGRIFPLSRDELVECAALLDSIRRRELDRVSIPELALDILAQQIVAAAGCDEWTEDELFETVRRAFPYRNLSRADFDTVVRMLADGFTTRRGRRNAYIHHDAVNKRLRGRRNARLTALTSGGAIPDNADYDVILDPSETLIGTLNEDFAIESMAGDIFQLGNASWRINRVERGRVRVEDAEGQPPTIPFWLGEAPGRTAELSAAVSRLREEVADRIENPRAHIDQNGVEPPDGAPDESESAYASRALAWLVEELGINQTAAEQIVEYLAAGKFALGVMPTQETLVMERFFDETGGTQLVIHSPFGSRLNRAWGLALRKRFCRKFNFELQAAATEDAIVLSLSLSHSFPLDDVFHYLRSATVRDLLIQALLAAPMFTIRWRWNANRALAVLRRRGGQRIPPQLQRIDAEDLLAAVFPDQVACGENLTGEREIPDHPLVNQTIRDCLEEAMDIDGLEALLRSIEKGEKRLIARDLNEPSPLAQEILSARPYAFLDDAPLEERRTQAVLSRRWLDPETASDLGTLDQSAIDRVRQESWPQVESADELHDALCQLGYLQESEGLTATPPWLTAAEGIEGWSKLFHQLTEDRRAAVMRPRDAGPVFWVAAERLSQLRAVYPEAKLQPEIADPRGDSQVGTEEALVELLRGRLEAIGPVTVSELANSAGLESYAVENALTSLETEGYVMRGRFTPGIDEQEWCVRRLLARIHRYTLNRLRQEIEPVAPSDFIRFLMSWQRVAPDSRGDGPDSVASLVDQLEGFEAPAAAWEGEILPARMEDYEPEWLDSLCRSGRVAWVRMTPPKGVGSGPVKSTPVALLNRKNMLVWDAAFPRPKASGEYGLTSSGQLVFDHLVSQGASFFHDFVEGTGLLDAQVEDGLAELVANGLVTADSFTGLRALLTPSSKRPPGPNAKRRGSVALYGMDNAGRWSRVNREAVAAASAAGVEGNGTTPVVSGEALDRVARVLLRRWGVVFRRLLDREGLGLQWRELLRVYRRLEARGEIRGGRFVAGPSGEQFALAEAVGSLRSIRRSPAAGTLVSVSAADPLNLLGIITTGPRVATIASNRILFQDGVPVAILEGGETRFLVELEKAAEWKARTALVRRPVPPQLRAYLGQSA
jgi:ATP-dependent Lhr-like helicase